MGGLALFGLGLATLLPISLSAAGTSSSLPVPVPVAVARVSTLGYLGSFTGPALIGYLSGQITLPIALMVPAVTVAVTAVAAPAVRAGHR